MLWLISAARS
ncbi:hypothetical protein VCHC68A1_02373A, partial [Vibrio cholerae HC-68A1]